MLMFIIFASKVLSLQRYNRILHVRACIDGSLSIPVLIMFGIRTPTVVWYQTSKSSVFGSPLYVHNMPYSAFRNPFLFIVLLEYRNRFNKIFGGFLMRQAFELAWANAYVFARQRPYIEFMDDILFQAPVDIGSLLFFNSQVTTQRPHFQKQF